MLPVCMALSPANGGIIVINEDNLGAGSGAGVIVIMTSGFAIKIASGLISANPGYGPEFDSSAADLEFFQATATFRYTNYEVKNLLNN